MIIIMTMTMTTRKQYASRPRGNAIPAGLLSDFDESLFR